MSDLSSNGHPEPEPIAPRIAPPEGQRAARGELASENDGETDVPALTVADAPAIEDSYEPPLGFDGANELSAPTLSAPRPDTPKDAELGLMDHLNELRRRLLYCALILGVGMSLTWNFGKTLQSWFSAPILKALVEKSVPGTPGVNPTSANELIVTDPTGAFTIYLQFSLVSALILTAPLLFWQVWRFIEPALTHSERRYSLVLVPFSSILFFLGAGLGYAVSPLFYQFFIAFQPENVSIKWDYSQTIMLMAKMLLVFGVTFQVPVIIIFLNKLGLLSRNILIEYWRHAVVLIFIVVSVLTPTWDPVTLAACAVPPCLLYVLSIWLVKWL